MLPIAWLLSQRPLPITHKSSRLLRSSPNNPVTLYVLLLFANKNHSFSTFFFQPTSQSVQYCQQAPKNAELNGLFQCQFQGDDPTVFVGGVPVGQPGTIPFGQTTHLSPPGSCPANPTGPIADGTQLTDITQDPGVGGGGGAAAPPPAATSAAPPVTTAAAAAAATTSPAAAPATSTTGFALSNGQDAQKLNAQFATLTASSSCTGM